MHIVFIIVENPAFQALLKMFLSTFTVCLLSNSNNFYNWIIKVFHKQNLISRGEILG